MALTGIIIAVTVFVLLAVFAGYARPEFPPLETKPDDPLMLEAREKARGSLGEFRRLIGQYPKTGIIKLRFVSNSDQVEYLWAEVLEPLGQDSYKVRLVTPPVTHTGQLDRLYTCREDDIEDWQVTDDQGQHHGAFSQRAMFRIARRDGVALPKKLQDIEKLYQ
ncbi:MAG: DUF2314 domain-containing protein [Alphaproteobacteria bacterium]|nr:MAG: DUF2314 domain-containing protein [Alphaproteobacteria bacterium]